MAKYKIVHAKKDLQGLVLGQYVNIQKPDTYDGAVYKFDATISDERAEKLAAAIDATLLKGAAEIGAKASPNKRPYVRNDDNSITFSFKIKEFEEGKRPFKLWDMAMNPMVDVPNLTSGTILNVNFAFYVSQYKNTAFISLQPTHCQVQHAEVYTGSSDAGPTFGAGAGYEVEEGGPAFAGNQPAPQEQAKEPDLDF